MSQGLAPAAGVPARRASSSCGKGERVVPGGGWRWHQGGLNIATKPKQTGYGEMRIWSHNVDRAGSAESIEQEAKLWAQAGIDVVVLQDPQFLEAARARVIERIKDLWGGEEMAWRYGDVKESEEITHYHGTMVLVHEKWKDLIHEWVEDPRGWGRFTGVILVSNKGEAEEPREQIAVVSCYAQHKGSKRYDWEKLQAIQGGEDESVQPEELWRRDLHEGIQAL